jgi:hypothetical protein
VSFYPIEHHSMPLADACVITKACRETHPHSKIEGFISKDSVIAISNQIECDRLNYYVARFTHIIHVASH